MARLYKRNGTNQYYVKHGYKKGSHVLWTTYQIDIEAVDFLASNSVYHNDRIPNNLYQLLLQNQLIYTNKSGPGVSESTATPEHAKQALARFNQANVNRAKEDDEPVKHPPQFTLPFEFFPKEAIHRCIIYPSKHYDYTLLKNYWRFFERNGLATYSNAKEYNNVIGRFLELTRMIRSYAETAYGESFEIYDELPDNLLSMPVIRNELAERFPAKEENEYDETNDYREEGEVKSLHLTYHLCKAVYSSVKQGIENYYKDHLAADFTDLMGAMMADMHEHLTDGTDDEHGCDSDFGYSDSDFDVGSPYAMAKAADEYISEFRWGW